MEAKVPDGSAPHRSRPLGECPSRKTTIRTSRQLPLNSRYHATSSREHEMPASSMTPDANSEDDDSSRIARSVQA
jgi:hypothetical protein